MTQDDAREALARKTVVYTVPGMDAVTVRSDVVYRTGDSGPLLLDLYYPPASDHTSAAIPAPVMPVMIVAMGYPDPTGRFRAMGFATSWARLTAASGIVVALYANEDPARDASNVLAYLRENAVELGLDANRIGVFASSGSGPVALELLMRDSRLACAVFLYAFLLDGEGEPHAAKAAATFGFAYPLTGRTMLDMPTTAVLVARAGHDQFEGLNQTLDRFVRDGLTANLPLTVINHADGPHAFDLFHDSETTRHVIRQVLAFLRFHLGA